MRKMNLILAATLALGSAAFTQTTASGSLKDDIQKDRQDLRQDRHELNQLESHVQQDKQRLQADRRSHASKAQIQAYALADNKLALNASWDEAMLALEIGVQLLKPLAHLECRSQRPLGIVLVDDGNPEDRQACQCRKAVPELVFVEGRPDLHDQGAG